MVEVYTKLIAYQKNEDADEKDYNPHELYLKKQHELNGVLS